MITWTGTAALAGVDPAAAEALADALLAAALAVDRAVGGAAGDPGLPGAVVGPTTAAAWRGPAAAAFADRRADLDDDVGWLVPALASAAGAVREYAACLAVARVRVRQAAAAAEAADREAATGPLGAAPLRWAEADRWRASVQAAVDDVAAAGDRLATTLFALLDPRPVRPRRVAEQVLDLGTAMTDEAAGSLYLLAGWSWDGSGWRTTVAATPDLLREQARHPVRSVQEGLQVEAFGEGRYGTGLGAILGTAWLRRLPALSHEVPGQTLAEMRLGVRLDRHEGPGLGHTLARHVVSDEFLRARILARDDVRGRALRESSSWTDRPTAEAHLTRAIGANAADLRRLMADERIARITLGEPVGPDAGRSWFLEGAELRSERSGSMVAVLRRGDSGWYLLTSFVQRRPPGPVLGGPVPDGPLLRAGS
ncbi:RNase A-like domain-containing protein [Kineococcus gynurae]|uniref:RNase A-like domain-containing protein n=1 Tax=Kineococcus gynurae TaxID=452979 RepID=A0ABV5LPN7_9ACTN